jgi:hypothetical protein
LIGELRRLGLPRKAKGQIYFKGLIHLITLTKARELTRIRT